MAVAFTKSKENLMNRFTRAAAAAFALAAMLVALGGTASAAPNHSSAPVFVQTDNTVGNQVVAYDRAADGTLTQAGVYNTGGLGGVLEGAVVDHLASQGSLAYDASTGCSSRSTPAATPSRCSASPATSSRCAR